MDYLGLVGFIVGFIWIPVAIFIAPVLMLIEYLGGRWSDKK